MPDVGATPVRPIAPLPQDPTQQALATVPVAPENLLKDAPYASWLPPPTVPAAAPPSTPAPDLTPNQAATMGLSASDVPVPVGNTLETSGHAKPSSGTTAEASPNATAPEPKPMEISDVPPVAKQVTTKDMIAKLMEPRHASTSDAYTGRSEAAKSGMNFGDFLTAAGGKLGDFLQRWGLGLQGKGEAPTRADIQQAQQFELQKAAVQNELLQRNMLLDNQYQQQRMGIQQGYQKANLTQEEKAALDRQIAALDQQYQNEKALLPAKIEAEIQGARYQRAINQNAPNAAAATVLGGK